MIAMERRDDLPACPMGDPLDVSVRDEVAPFFRMTSRQLRLQIARRREDRRLLRRRLLIEIAPSPKVRNP